MVWLGKVTGLMQGSLIHVVPKIVHGWAEMGPAQLCSPWGWGTWKPGGATPPSPLLLLASWMKSRGKEESQLSHLSDVRNLKRQHAPLPIRHPGCPLPHQHPQLCCWKGLWGVQQRIVEWVAVAFPTRGRGGDSPQVT